MKTLLISFSLVGLVAAFASPALADCQCVAAGKKYGLGEVACLKLPNGNRLARCGMVLNNSSWTPLQEACPYAMTETAPISHLHDHQHATMATDIAIAGTLIHQN